MDITDITFENMLLRLYEFQPSNPSDKDHLERSWSSPAYLNTVAPGFWVKNTVPLPSFIQKVEQMADENGFTKAKANRAVKVKYFGEKVATKDYSAPITDGVLEGFDYTFAKGPSGEQLVFAQFSGSAAQTLEAAFKNYGGVSLAFDDCNPYKWGGYKNICQ